jgi:hypothetical protein
MGAMGAGAQEGQDVVGGGLLFICYYVNHDCILTERYITD